MAGSHFTDLAVTTVAIPFQLLLWRVPRATVVANASGTASTGKPVRRIRWWPFTRRWSPA